MISTGLMELMDKQTVSQSDVRERAEQIDSIKKIISVMNLEKNKGAVMFGPSGTGKSTVGVLAAKALHGSFMLVTSAMFIGETGPQALKAVMMEARKWQPCILAFDEGDFCFRRRQIQCFDGTSLVAVFTGLYDSIQKKHEQVLCLITTNRPTVLDDAVIRRCPHKIYLKLPSEVQRRDMVNQILSGENHDLTAQDVASIAAWTEGLSSSNMDQLINSAKASAGTNLITLNHFTVYKDTIIPSVSEEELQYYSEYDRAPRRAA